MGVLRFQSLVGEFANRPVDIILLSRRVGGAGRDGVRASDLQGGHSGLRLRRLDPMARLCRSFDPTFPVEARPE